MIVFVLISEYRSTGNHDRENNPKITIAIKQRKVIIGLLTAPSYRLIRIVFGVADRRMSFPAPAY